MPRTNFREIICVLALTCVSLRVEKLELKYNEHIRGLMISAAKTILGVKFHKPAVSGTLSDNVYLSLRRYTA